MDCYWIKINPSLNKGLSVINKLDESRFEQFLKRIVVKLKLQDAEIFTEEERFKLGKLFDIDQDSLVLSIKTLQYIMKRTLKYIFMPTDLKCDLKAIGLNNDKAESIVKMWSVETRATLNEIGTIGNDQADNLKFSWNLNAELSSDIHKKCKIPKAYVSFVRNNNENEIEFAHAELYSVFLQFESIQTELDNLTLSI